MRKHYIDNIRWATVVLVLIYHVFYLFNHVGVLGNVTSLGDASYLDSLLYFVYPWFMVLLFVIAGMSTRYALNSRTHKQFIHERINKLLVPSTLGLFIYQWIAGYFNIKIGGVMEQIPAFIRYPLFVLSGTGPLWFIQMLFIFSLLIVVIRKLDRGDKLWKMGGKCNLVILLILAVPVWGSSWLLNLPVITTYRFGIYFFTFLLGYFVFSHDEVEKQLEKAHLPMLIVAIILGISYTVYYFGRNYAEADCLQSVFTNIYLWVSVLAILGCGKAWFNATSPFTKYMTRSSFGLYIIHYPIVIAVCYVLANYSQLPTLVIYVVALVLELILTTIVYEMIRRLPVIRFFVLGIKKPKKVEEKVTC